MMACTGSVFLGGGKIFDALRYERERAAEAVDKATVNATLSN
jgi:hypothetical protein